MKTSLFALSLRPLVAALLSASVCVAMAADPKASQFYEDALARFEKKDHAGAIIQLKNALKIDNKLLPVHVLLGKALLANGELSAAEVALNDALRLGVDRAEVVVPLAETLVAQAKHSQVLENGLLQATGLPAPLKFKLLLVRAGAFADIGQPKEALRAIDEARGLDGVSPDSWLAEVPIRIRARQFAEAINAADKAVALAPASAQALYMRGSIAQVQPDFSSALSFYARALRLQPNHAEALLARAGVYADLRRYEEAEQDVKELRRLFPREPRGAYLQALLAEQRGEVAAAKSALAEVTAMIDPIPIEFMLYRPQMLILNGLAHHALSEREKAKPYLEAAHRLQVTGASKVLAQIYLFEKSIDSAIVTLENYLRRSPNDVQALALLASCHMSQGRHARATQLMQDALRTHESPQLRTVLGLSLIEGGKQADATAELEAAFKKDPGQVQAGAALVGLHLSAKKPDRASAIAALLVKREPGNAGFQNLLGMAKSAARDVSGAKAAFEQAVKLDGGFISPKVNLARLAVSAGAYEDAEAQFLKVLQKDDKNVDALMELSLLAGRRKQVEDSVRMLEKAADFSGPTDLRPGLLLVEQHLRAGRVDAAGEAAKRLSAKAPESVAVLLAMSQVNLANNKPEMARTSLTRASRTANYDPSTLLRIALLQIQAADLKGASYSLEKVLSTDSGNLAAQALLSEVDLRLGDAQRAEQRARRIVATSPKRAVGHSLLGDVAMANRAVGVAMDHYARAHQVEPSTQSLLRLFQAQSAGDPQGATRLVERWLKSHPKDVLAQRTLADSFARAGNWAAARATYESVLKQAPQDAEVLNNLANVLLASRDRTALSVAERALALRPTSAHIIGTVGWAAFQAGQTDRALQLLRDARLRDPSNAETRYFLAAVLANTGKANEARAELETALGSGAKFASSVEAERLLRTLK